MFNKLLSSLPFNPSLIQQVAFYSKRLRKETAIRRLGFLFIALTMLIQIFAVMSPAQAGSACDPYNNDIIHCGFTQKKEAVDHCRNNDQQFGTILSFYHVSCDKLATAEENVIINENDYNRTLKSVGRVHFDKAGATQVSIPGVAKPLHWRYLWSWGNIPNPKVLRTTDSSGQLVMVMYDCGNLIVKDNYKLDQPQPDAQLTLAKLNEPSGDVKPGDIIDYTLVFANKGGTAAFFSVNDSLPAEVTFQSSEHSNWLFTNKAPELSWANNAPPYYTFGNTDAIGMLGFIKLKVRVNDNVPSGTTICNKGWLLDVNTQTAQTRRWSDTQACNTVRRVCEAGEVLNSTGTGCEKQTVPKVTCTYLKVAKEDSRTKRTFETKVAPFPLTNGPTIKSYTYDFGDKKTEKKDSSAVTNTISHEFKEAGVYTVSVVVDTSLGPVSQGCTVQAIVKPPTGTPLVRQQKKAKNITQKLEDATTKKAAAGDVIEYTLTKTNYGDADDKNVSWGTEDLSDVLQYAQLDTNSLSGGIFDEQTHTLGWNTTFTLKAGASASKTFRVQIKNPIPENPTPGGNPDAFDFVLTNSYGNTINIELPKSVSKITERTTTTLVNTGPGTSLTIAFSMTLIVGYFFARSRLLTQELEIVKHEYTSGGA